jgi:hypothetical protein
VLAHWSSASLALTDRSYGMPRDTSARPPTQRIDYALASAQARRVSAVTPRDSWRQITARRGYRSWAPRRISNKRPWRSHNSCIGDRRVLGCLSPSCVSPSCSPTSERRAVNTIFGPKQINLFGVREVLSVHAFRRDM